MLHNVNDIRGDRIAARDGEIGKIEALYFDDEQWCVRYFVVDTGSWLSGRKVLISPVSVDPEKSSERALAVTLSREQVERSPAIDTDKPVSRQYEEAYARHYGVRLFSAAPENAGLRTDERSFRRGHRLDDATREAAESHLRSSAEVVGYAIRAADGRIGHVDDLRVDDRDWTICGLVVDTGSWLPGRKVQVPPHAIESIDWHAKEVRLALTRAEIERAFAAA